MECVIASLGLEQREAIAREWWAWNAAEGRGDDIRFGIESLDSGIAFGDAKHARDFMNSGYDRLIASVRREAGRNWKP